jgi:flagellar basal-body rod protein FlgB
MAFCHYGILLSVFEQNIRNCSVSIGSFPVLSLFEYVFSVPEPRKSLFYVAFKLHYLNKRIVCLFITMEEKMPINKLFDGSIALTAKALNLLSARQGVIQSNIANMETPGYKAKDINFSEVMRKVVTQQGELVRTNNKHIPSSPGQRGKAGKIVQGGKPVDIDEEMLKLSENQLLYQVSTRIISKKFEGLRYIIDEGGK